MSDQNWKPARQLTEADIIASFSSSSPREVHNQWDKQTRSYKTGDALRGHTNSAHKGVEDPKCPACKELRIRCGLTPAL